jgi:uncharacterized protein YgbK (DUF1537 family)
LIDYRVVGAGAGAVRARIGELRDQRVGIAIVDAISNADLRTIGAAVSNLPLVTAGSGVAIGLPINFGLAPSNAASSLPSVSGARAIVSGSCSTATNLQVRAFIDTGGQAFRIDPTHIASGADVAAEALAWATSRLQAGPVLVYSTADRASVAEVQQALGIREAGEIVEAVLATIARRLVDQGVRRLIVAGGETAGACVRSLGITRLKIGPQIDPGVPWCYARDGANGVALHLALKSGNFGADDFFTRAFAQPC